MDILNGSPGLGSINFLTGTRAGSAVQLHKSTVTIGREPGNDIVVTDASVSRHHATITFNGGTWPISNLTHRNIATINQREVPPLQQSPISERVTITLGTRSEERRVGK